MGRAGLLLAALALIGGPAVAGPASEVSEAERRLFLDAHLAQMHPPATLAYRFAETTLSGARTADALELSLKAGAEGRCCAVTVKARGASFDPLPPEIEAAANPVILYFLERDLRQMQAATGGGTNYFRRLIRLALADEAQVRGTTIRFAGRELAAQEIRVQPYRADPRRAQYAGLADKTYAFVLAKGLPGEVYQIKTTVPAATADAPALAETALTLDEGNR